MTPIFIAAGIVLFVVIARSLYLLQNIRRLAMMKH